MIYLSIFAIVVVLVMLYLDAASRRTKAKRLEKIRKAWGTPKVGELNFYRIGRYADLMNQMPHSLSQQTRDDIDFHQLFAFIDRTTSRIGQQFLFRQVAHPFHAIADLTKLNSIANVMAGDAVLREEVQKELIKLDNAGASIE